MQSNSRLDLRVMPMSKRQQIGMLAAAVGVVAAVALVFGLAGKLFARPSAAAAG